MAFLIGGANSAADTGYDVANSCRFEDGDSAYLSRSIGSGNQKTFTFSAWVKRGNLGTEQHLFGQREDDNNRTNIFFTSGDLLNIRSNSSGAGLHVNVITTQVFRDVSAWYHIVVAVDTEDGTAANRVKTYVNGTQVTSFGTETYPAEDATLVINNAVSHEVGSYDTSAGYFDGYMAEVVWIDGTQYAASNFGEFNADSPAIWQPTDVSGLTFGTNGFYLDFEASGNLGNDANGGTDWGETNLAATDQATDTPTNNFCTISPYASQTRIQTLSEGNLQAYYSSGANWGTNWATIAATAGKWYVEVLVTAYGSNGSNIGVMNVDSTAFPSLASIGNGADEFSAGYYSTGILYRNSETNHTGNTNDDFDSYGADDIISIAMDLDNGFFYWAKNGTWQNSGDPTSAGTGTGGVATSYLTANETYTVVANIRSGTTISWNFGNPPTTFSISSGNADADGYGNFEYAPPSGYFALCTKNLAEYGG